MTIPAAERQESSPSSSCLTPTLLTAVQTHFFLCELPQTWGAGSCMAPASHLKLVLSLFNSLPFRLDDSYSSCSKQNMRGRGWCCYYFCWTLPLLFLLLFSSVIRHFLQLECAKHRPRISAVAAPLLNTAREPLVWALLPRLLSI